MAPFEVQAQSVTMHMDRITWYINYYSTIVSAWAYTLVGSVLFIVLIVITVMYLHHEYKQFQQRRRRKDQNDQ